MKKLSLFFVLSLVLIYSQNISLKGVIKDKETGYFLSYANVFIPGTNQGTSSNKNGEFIIKLDRGNYKLVASYIGYSPDTLVVDLQKEKLIEFNLKPVEVELQTVTVKPGINPALAIVRGAIETKQERNKKLNTYEFHAFTKGVVRSNKDFSSSRPGSVNLNILSDNKNQKSDTLGIAGIIENESKGYFSSPNNRKDLIIARKQTANFPSTMNVFTGSMLRNFYDDYFNFNNIDIPSPIADIALDYYYYILEDSLRYGNEIVYKISFDPIDKNDPGFEGKIYITKKDFNMIKVDCGINRAANVGGIFDTMRFIQQFLNYENFYMPVDYRMIGKLGFFGIKFAFDFNTIMDNYLLNKPLSENVFDDVIVKVNKDADKKDSTYWNIVKVMETTPEEEKAYFVYDSLKTANENKLPEFSFLSDRIYLTKNFRVFAPLSMYHFNRVEGHSLDFGFDLIDLANEKLNINTDFSYGFSDKKFKQNFSAIFKYSDYYDGRISMFVKNSTASLFEESIDYTNLTSTLNSFINKKDDRNYFYRKGISLNINQKLNDNIRLGLGYRYFEDRSAKVNSDFSVFKQKEKYNINREIDEIDLSTITLSFRINFNKYKYIEDVDARRAVNTSRTNFYLSGDITKALNTNKFTKYTLNANFYARSFATTDFSIILSAKFSDTALPIQHMFALPGAMMNIGKDNTMRTIGVGEFYGDRVYTAFFNYDLDTELFKILQLHFLRKWELTSNVYFNLGYAECKEMNKLNKNYPVKIYSSPLMEAGFGIGHKLSPISLEFTWRLNHRDDKNFVIGFKMPLL